MINTTNMVGVVVDRKSVSGAGRSLTSDDCGAASPAGDEARRVSLVDRGDDGESSDMDVSTESESDTEPARPNPADARLVSLDIQSSPFPPSRPPSIPEANSVGTGTKPMIDLEATLMDELDARITAAEEAMLMDRLDRDITLAEENELLAKLWVKIEAAARNEERYGSLVECLGSADDNSPEPWLDAPRRSVSEKEELSATALDGGKKVLSMESEPVYRHTWMIKKRITENYIPVCSPDEFQVFVVDKLRINHPKECWSLSAQLRTIADPMKYLVVANGTKAAIEMLRMESKKVIGNMEKINRLFNLLYDEESIVIDVALDSNKPIGVEVTDYPSSSESEVVEGCWVDRLIPTGQMADIVGSIENAGGSIAILKVGKSSSLRTSKELTEAYNKSPLKRNVIVRLCMGKSAKLDHMNSARFKKHEGKEFPARRGSLSRVKRYRNALQYGATMAAQRDASDLLKDHSKFVARVPVLRRPLAKGLKNAGLEYTTVISDCNSIEIDLIVNPSRSLGVEVFDIMLSQTSMDPLFRGLWIKSFKKDGQLWKVLGGDACINGAALLSIGGQPPSSANELPRMLKVISRGKNPSLRIRLVFFDGTDLRGLDYSKLAPSLPHKPNPRRRIGRALLDAPEFLTGRLRQQPTSETASLPAATSSIDLNAGHTVQSKKPTSGTGRPKSLKSKPLVAVPQRSLATTSNSNRAMGLPEQIDPSTLLPDSTSLDGLGASRLAKSQELKPGIDKSKSLKPKPAVAMTQDSLSKNSSSNPARTSKLTDTPSESSSAQIVFQATIPANVTIKSSLPSKQSNVTFSAAPTSAACAPSKPTLASQCSSSSESSKIPDSSLTTMAKRHKASTAAPAFPSSGSAQPQTKKRRLCPEQPGPLVVARFSREKQDQPQIVPSSPNGRGKSSCTGKRQREDEALKSVSIPKKKKKRPLSLAQEQNSSSAGSVVSQEAYTIRRKQTAANLPMAQTAKTYRAIINPNDPIGAYFITEDNKCKVWSVDQKGQLANDRRVVRGTTVVSVGDSSNELELHNHEMLMNYYDVAKMAGSDFVLTFLNSDIKPLIANKNDWSSAGNWQGFKNFGWAGGAALVHSLNKYHQIARKKSSNEIHEPTVTIGANQDPPMAGLVDKGQGPNQILPSIRRTSNPFLPTIPVLRTVSDFRPLMPKLFVPQSILKKPDNPPKAQKKSVNFSTEKLAQEWEFLRGSSSQERVLLDDTASKSPCSQELPYKTARAALKEVIDHGTCDQMVSLLNQLSLSRECVTFDELEQLYHHIKYVIDQPGISNDKEMKQKKSALNIYWNASLAVARATSLRSWKSFQFRIRSIILDFERPHVEAQGRSSVISGAIVLSVGTRMSRSHAKLGDLAVRPIAESIIYDDVDTIFNVMNNVHMSHEKREIGVDVHEGLTTESNGIYLGRFIAPLEQLEKAALASGDNTWTTFKSNQLVTSDGLKGGSVEIEFRRTSAPEDYMMQNIKDCSTKLMHQVQNIKRFNAEAKSGSVALAANIIGPDRSTLLHAAINCKSVEGVKALMKLGADPHQKNETESPITTARNCYERAQMKSRKMKRSKKSSRGSETAELFKSMLVYLRNPPEHVTNAPVSQGFVLNGELSSGVESSVPSTQRPSAGTEPAVQAVSHNTPHAPARVETLPQQNDIPDDITIVRETIACLLKESPSTSGRVMKSTFGGSLRLLYPHIFPAIVPVKTFLARVVSAGLLVESGSGASKTVCLNIPGHAATSRETGACSSKPDIPDDITIVRETIACLLKESPSTSGRVMKSTFGGSLRLLYPHIFPAIVPVKTFLARVVSAGLLVESGSGNQRMVRLGTV